MSTITYAIWAFAAGALIPLMAILNVGLGRASGGTIQATVLLFATGLISSLVLAAIAKLGLNGSSKHWSREYTLVFSN